MNNHLFAKAVAQINCGGSPSFTGQVLTEAQVAEVRVVLDKRIENINSYFTNVVATRRAAPATE